MFHNFIIIYDLIKFVIKYDIKHVTKRNVTYHCKVTYHIIIMQRIISYRTV